MTDNSDMTPQALAEACIDSLYDKDIAAQALGIKIVSVEPGKATITMPVREDMLNGHATCHGGYLFALADTAFAYACNGRNAPTVAQGCTIDFVKPGRPGELLTAVAEERNLAGRTGLYDVTVINPDGEAIAHFRGKSYRIRGTVLPE